MNNAITATETITELINIGFCQSKFYRPTVWRHAREIMEIAADQGLVQRYVKRKHPANAANTKITRSRMWGH